MHHSAKLFLSIACVCALAAVSCTREPDPATQKLLLEEELIQTKVVRLDEQIEEDRFMVKFNAVPTEEELTRLAGMDGVKSVSRQFIPFPGKEALEAEFGLDRWYKVELEEGANVHRLVKDAALFSSVQTVEYKAIPTRASDLKSYPAYAPDTKAGSGVFNDPYLNYQWHYDNQGNASYSPNAYKGGDVNVKDVWANLCTGDRSIIVAVIDEGVKYTHPDLKDNMWKNEKEIPGNGIDDDGNGYIDDVYGFNFCNMTADISWDKSNGSDSDSGHGTHCAGTIAAVNNNGVGVSGIAGGSGNNDGCRIMTCQIFSCDPKSNYNGDSAAAIKYAADMGASVISCSFGYRSPFPSDNSFYAMSSAEIDAIHYFEASKNNDVLDGNIAIFAAGNENHNYAHYPGAFYDIISVSALGPDFLPTYYTNYGPGCNIAAPGGEAYHLVNKWNSMVLSTLCSENGNLGVNGEYDQKGLDYGYMQGTSMACPHVSGVVALALSYAHQRGKKFGRDEFKRMILASTKDIDQRISKQSSKSYSYGKSDLPMAPYYHQMGTGAIDAWRLMMHIDGIPCATAQIGRQQWISLDNAFGTASVSLTYLAVDVPQSTVDALGLQKIKGNPSGSFLPIPEGDCYAFVQFGRLYIHPTKIGSGKISISMVGGGDHLGGGNNPPGGMEVKEEISIIAREADGGNGTGGWL